MKTIKRSFILFTLFCIQSLMAESLRELCKDKDYAILPHPDKNTQFVVCVYESGEERNCPVEKCFDESEMSCSKEACTAVDPLDKKLAADYCNDNALYNVAIPSISCNHYYICLGEIEPVYVACPNNMHYSQYERKCVTPPLAKCQAQEKLCEDDQKKNVTYAAGECYSYYKCETKQLIKKSCSYSQKFDEKSGECVSDIQLSCDHAELPDCSDPANANVYFPHKSCARFYACVNKALFEGQCSNGYRYDSKSSSCKEDRAGLCDN